MGEKIEDMINVLETQIEFIKEKVRYNNLCSSKEINQMTYNKF